MILRIFKITVVLSCLTLSAQAQHDSFVELILCS